MLILALFFVGTTGCVSIDEHKRLQTAFDQAQAQLAEAENDLAASRARITELEGKLAELNRLIDGNSGGIGALKQERDLLAQQLADLQKKYDQLLALEANTPASPRALTTPFATLPPSIRIFLSLMNGWGWFALSLI